MAYTTTTLVRSESGFDNNSDVTDATITSYINMAHGSVKGFVARIYDISALDTDFTGSQAKDYLEGIETLWASGLLLIKEYGAEALDSDKDGYKKLELAKSLLMDLEEEKVILLDSNDEEYSRNDADAAGTVQYGDCEEDENIFDLDDVF